MKSIREPQGHVKGCLGHMWQFYTSKGIPEALDKRKGSLTHMGGASKNCRQGPIGKWEHRLRHVTREPSGRGP